MDVRRKVRAALVSNAVILVLVVVLVSVCASGSPFWRVGWSPDLVIVSVAIDSPGKYVGLVGVLFVVEVARVLAEDIGSPILGFTVYNPDKRHISEFGKRELYFYANSMFLVTEVRRVFLTLVAISQIDIALWQVVASQSGVAIAIAYLLSTKRFGPVDDSDETELLV